MNALPIQQQFFKRMTRLVLFLGIVIGLLVAVVVIWLSVLAARHWGAFPLSAPLVTEGLLPLLGFLLLAYTRCSCGGSNCCARDVLLWGHPDGACRCGSESLGILWGY